MGSTTVEAERRVRAQRALIEGKIASLEERVGEDASAVRERLTHHVTHFPDLVPGGSTVVEQAQAHPYTAIAGALGLGVALGMATGGDGHSNGHSNGHERGGVPGFGAASGATARTAGLFTGLTGTLLAPFMPYVRSYVDDMAREVVRGFSERPRPEGSAMAEDGAQSHGASPA